MNHHRVRSWGTLNGIRALADVQTVLRSTGESNRHKPAHTHPHTPVQSVPRQFTLHSLHDSPGYQSLRPSPRSDVSPNGILTVQFLREASMLNMPHGQRARRL